VSIGAPEHPAAYAPLQPARLRATQIEVHPPHSDLCHRDRATGRRPAPAQAATAAATARRRGRDGPPARSGRRRPRASAGSLPRPSRRPSLSATLRPTMLRAARARRPRVLVPTPSGRPQPVLLWRSAPRSQSSARVMRTWRRGGPGKHVRVLAREQAHGDHRLGRWPESATAGRERSLDSAASRRPAAEQHTDGFEGRILYQ